MQNTAFNTCAKAKLVYYKNKDCYKLVIAFNVTQTDAKGRYIFPVQAKCNYVSGDMNKSAMQRELPRVMALAKLILRTENIIMVGGIKPVWN